MFSALKSAARAVAFLGTVLLTAAIGPAHAAPPFVASAVDLEIAPDQLDKFRAALKENGAATIREPGCRRYDILQSAPNPNQIFIYEVYANQAAVQAHRETEHFKKYVAATKDMVVKRQSRPMVAVDSYVK
jgi:autoinducer 2-degrading protein